jgi:hypothetical protein
MAILSKGTAFTAAQQVTSSNLNSLVDNAQFVSGASGTTDDSTLEVNGGGRLQAKDLGITAAKLSANSVTTTKVSDGAITPAKLSTGAPTWDGTSTMTLTFADVDSIFTIENSESTSNRNPGLYVDNYNGSESGAPLIQMRQARGTKASPTASQSGDSCGIVIFTGHNGTNFDQVARISVSAAENFSGSQTGVTMRFLTTASGGTAETEKMRISETGGILVGTSTDVPSAIFSIASTTRGFLPPRMTTTQRNAISAPAEGLMIYNSTTKKLNFYNGTGWEAVTSA